MTRARWPATRVTDDLAWSMAPSGPPVLVAVDGLHLDVITVLNAG
ncbi:MULTISPECIES: hypothetical protein [unclassified Nonomuraea]|nr:MULTISPECIES: hypothetical protein [unclassified Nonomuraea]